jgi:protein SCO1/2
VINPIRRVFPIALIVAGLIVFSSCHGPTTKRYPFSGRVVSIDSVAESALIDGDAVPGFMEAMAMPYKVKPAAMLNHLLPGDSISADVVVVRKNDEAPDTPHAAANMLHMPAPREDVPDFSFTNQSGRHISLKQYRGKVLLLTFIYTRCPFPDFCPRVSSNFAEIYKQLGANPDLVGTHLLSISFDPEHDTSQVLRDYGFSVAHTHDPALFGRWEFAAPRAADLTKIADFFALTVKPEGGTITHSLSTAVIDPDGKIVKWYHGSDWQPSDLIKDAASAHEAKG